MAVIVAYVWWPADGTSIIRVAKVKSGKVYDVTSPLRVDQSPAWDPDGKYLYFISTRDFNPVYDALQFDLSFPQASRPFVVTLRNDVPSPFVPKPQPDPSRSRPITTRDEGKSPESKPLDIEIDFDGITGRVLGFPGRRGRVPRRSSRRANACIFTRFPVSGIKPAAARTREDDGQGTLLAYDFEQQRLATIAQRRATRSAWGRRPHADLSFARPLARDRRAQRYARRRDEQKPPAEAGRNSGWIDLDRASVEIVPRDEWAQMYREAWRLQTEQFWVEDMNDIDWDRVYDRYAALLPRVRTRSELSDFIWEMQGELGTSHAYEYGGDYRVPPQYQRGFLGADLRGTRSAADIASNASTAAIRGTATATRRWPSRARRARRRRHRRDRRKTPDERISPGPFARQFRGPEISHYRASAQRTRNERSWSSAGKRSIVALSRVGRGESPLRSRKNGGRVGYIHIPDMGPCGFAEFHRGYLKEFDRGARSWTCATIAAVTCHRCFWKSSRVNASDTTRRDTARDSISARVGRRPDRRADESICRIGRRHFQPLL